MGTGGSAGNFGDCVDRRLRFGGCDDPNSQTEAFYGLQINGLASTPFNIAVGGTDFAPLAGPDGSGLDFTNYVSLTSKKGTLESAKGYIPESPWNDSSFTFPAYDDGQFRCGLPVRMPTSWGLVAARATARRVL